MIYDTKFELFPYPEAPFRLNPLVKTSMFTGVQCREYPDIQKIYGFLNHKMGISYKNIARYKNIAQQYENEQKLLAAYLKNLDKNAGCVTTLWSLLLHGWGRVYPRSHLSASIMHRPTRHALCEGRYLDFDMENAHLAIFLQLLQREAIRTSLTYANLAEYGADPKAIRAQIMEYYGVSKDVAKQLPIRLLYGGSIDMWKQEFGVSQSLDMPLITNLEKELKAVMEVVWRDNQHIHNDLLNAKEEYRKKNRKAQKRSVMSEFAQTIERVIQEAAIYVTTQDYNLPIAEVVPCQDGFMIRDTFASRADSIIDRIVSFVQEMFGIFVKWVVKPFDEAVEIPAEAELSIDKPVGTLAFDNDLDAANYLLEGLKPILKCSRGALYMRMGNHVWTSKESNIQKAVFNRVVLSQIYRPGREEGVFTPFVQNNQAAKNIAHMILSLVTETDDYGFENVMFQSSLGYTLFQNGYYNWREGFFVPFGDDSFDDNIIFNELIPYDFEIHKASAEEAQHIKNNMDFIKQQLFYTPFGEEMGDYYIQNLARGLAGDCMKRFLFGIGPSNAGKSLMSDALKSVCGGYFGSFNGQNLTYRNTSQDEAQQLRWTMLLRHKRIIVSNEIKKGTPIDGNCLKKLANGGLDDLTGRGHGGDETNFKVAFLPICFANDIDDIKPYDDAVEKRVRAIPYTKVCVDKPEHEIDPRFEIKMDATLAQEIQTPEFRTAFMAILMESYMRFNEGGRSEIEPAGVSRACAQTFGENRKVLDLFLDEYEITGNDSDFVTSADLKIWLESSRCGVSMTKFASELKQHAERNGFTNVLSKQKKISGKPTQIWLGIRLIPSDD